MEYFCRANHDWTMKTVNVAEFLGTDRYVRFDLMALPAKGKGCGCFDLNKKGRCDSSEATRIDIKIGTMTPGIDLVELPLIKDYDEYIANESMPVPPPPLYWPNVPKAVWDKFPGLGPGEFECKEFEWTPYLSRQYNLKRGSLNASLAACSTAVRGAPGLLNGCSRDFMHFRSRDRTCACCKASSASSELAGWLPKPGTEWRMYAICPGFDGDTCYQPR